MERRRELSNGLVCAAFQVSRRHILGSLNALYIECNPTVGDVGERRFVTRIGITVCQPAHVGGSHRIRNGTAHNSAILPMHELLQQLSQSGEVLHRALD
jgi:hypothetical protein